MTNPSKAPPPYAAWNAFVVGKLTGIEVNPATYALPFASIATLEVPTVALMPKSVEYISAPDADANSARNPSDAPPSPVLNPFGVGAIGKSVEAVSEVRNMFPAESVATPAAFWVASAPLPPKYFEY